MLNARDRRQAELLDAYRAALARDPTALPPGGLAPAAAAVERRLAQPPAPEPDPTFLVALRRQLDSAAGVPAAGRSVPPHGWAIHPRQPLPLDGVRVPSGGIARRGMRALLVASGNALAAAIIVATIAGTLALVWQRLPAPARGGWGATAGPPGSPTTAASSPQPRDGQLITLAEAEAAVRAFLGDPVAILDGEYADNTQNPQDPTPRVFTLRRSVPGSPVIDIFTVDADTAEVLRATLSSNGRDGTLRQPTPEAEATARAEAFAHGHFAGFERLTRRGVTRTGDWLEVSWTLRAPDSGAWLPTGVSIEVDLTTGGIYRYWSRRADYTGPTLPRLSREEAAAAALAAARADPRYAGATAPVGQVELYGLLPGMDALAGADPRLVWHGVFADLPQQSDLRAEFDVDALTGEVLTPPVAPGN